jgi:tetratricopeptide (TPR) repeat protein
MMRIFVAVVLGLMGGALQGQWLQQSAVGSPAQARDPAQIDSPHSSDPFDQDVTACSRSKDLACGSNILVSPPRGGVSAGTLAHKHSKAAVQAFNRGHRAWNKGQSEQVLRYLGEAVRLDPDFVEARVDLGAVYAKTGQPEKALEQDERALALEPNLAVLQSNKAAALLMLSRWEEAEQAARRAVQLEPGSIDANYVLGIAMMMQGKITPEVAAHLAMAVKKHPRARAFLAEVQADLAAEPKK